MNIFTVIGFILIGMVLFTGLFALMITRLDAAVAQNVVDIETDKQRYQPETTLGFSIAQDADKTAQFRDARQEAAKRAARLDRGANMRIGSQGSEHGKTTSDELTIDPVSAFKIAEYQGWTGMGDFANAQAAALGIGDAPVAATAAKIIRKKLVPGKDYEIVAITAGMSAAEKRSARAANGKSKSAAYKVLKESGQHMVEESIQTAATTTATAQVAGAAAAAPAAPVISGPSLEEVLAEAGITPPQLVEITDDMDAAKKKEVRLANTKAKSAYKKAIKAAGIDPKAHPTAAELEAAKSAAPPPTAAPAAAPAAAAIPSGPTLEEVLAEAGIAPLELTELTDDMDSAAKKAARLANTKAKSAYKKALKAAGIDPKAHPTAAEVAAAKAAASPAPAAPAPAAPPPAAPATESAPADDPAAAAGISKPDLIEITDDMSAEDKKKARLANTKAKSAFKKALKAAGIDPKSVSI
ncbi:MAG: hypothetical protein AAGD96_26600 [Chloroflexota bacterium]